MNTTNCSPVANKNAGRLRACVEGSFQLSQATRLVCDYRGRCSRERSAAFTPLPRGTVPVTLRIFPSAGNGRTVKRPEGRAPAALGRGAKHVPASRRTLGAPAHFREI